MLYKNFKQRLLALGIALMILCVIILGAFVYNYFLSREISNRHYVLADMAKAFHYHAAYLMEHAVEAGRKAPLPLPGAMDCELGQLLSRLETTSHGERVYYEEVVRKHIRFHQILPEASFAEMVVASNELNASLGDYNIYLSNRLAELEDLRTKVIVAIALPGLLLIIALLVWLYSRLYSLVQHKIVSPLRQSLAILSQAGVYIAPHDDEPEAIHGAVRKVARIIEMDDARRKMYPFWNSVFTEEELLNGSLELFGENNLIASAAFYRYDSFTDELILDASYSFPKGGEQRVPFGVGPIGEAAKKHKPVFVDNTDLELPLGFAAMQPARFGFYPIGTQTLYGVLALAFQSEGTREQMTVVEFFAAQLGIVMDRVRQLNDLKKMTWELGNKTKALHKELRYKDSILNSSADGIVILGVDGNIHLFSKGAEEITGYSAVEAVGSPCSNVFCHLDQDFNLVCDTEICANCMVANNNTPVKGQEFYIKHKKGHYVPVLLSAAPLYNDKGELTEILQVFKDVTELRTTLTQLEQANRSKTEFLATMSHELRTPLNAVLGFTELLETESFGPLNDRQKRYTNNILTAGKHLLSLINDILDISRVESGKVDWEYDLLDIPQLFGTTVSLLREKAVQNQIKLSLEIHPELKEFAGDERKLKQILYNLINNALKFTPEGGQVGVKVGKEEGNMLITVWDTGIGIPQDKRDVIFEPFYQVDNYLTRTQQGSGLGLALVKKMVELAGGRIWLDDEEGKSTIVKITLPATREIPQEEEPGIGEDRERFIPAEFKQSTPSTQNRALIVEDDENSAELLIAYLKDMGFVGEVVTTGEEGMAAIKNDPPDLIVLDIMLPGIDGWEMLAEIKSQPSSAHIPVIVISILEEREKGLALGAVDYLTKPINRTMLQNCIQKSLACSQTGGCRALVVDDDTKVLELFNEYLSSMGVETFLALNPQEGLNLAKEILPDVIFLDLIMPGMDGFTFLQRIEADETLKDIPVIVVTSKSLTPGEKGFLEKRVEHVARKSEFRQQAFQRVVKKLIDKGGS